MSIADTLHDAVNAIDAYRRDDGPTASGNVDQHIATVRDAMEVLRCELDVDLHGNQPPFRAFTEPDDVMPCGCSSGSCYCDDDADGCLGHPAGPFDPMGQTVYCDGTCRKVST